MLPIGPATVGDVICFEVAYDEVVRDTVTGGAQLLVVQTNNATFNEAEARQQLAMVRLRAVEHGRPALMASTVGVSAFVDEAGNVHDATAFNAPAVIVRDVTLGTSRTMATETRCRARASAGRWRRWRAGRRVVVRRRDGVDGRTRRKDVSGLSEGYPGVGRVLVIIPTYNEAENVRDHRRPAPHAPCPTVDVLIADDNSPDGTGAIADELAAADPQIHVLHRPGKQGLGAAYLAGFALGPRARLRRRGGDGRRRLARPRGAAPAARRPAPTPTSCSAPAGCRGGKVRQLAAAPATCSPAAATSTPGSRWACRSGTPPAATAPTG